MARNLASRLRTLQEDYAALGARVCTAMPQHPPVAGMDSGRWRNFALNSMSTRACRHLSPICLFKIAFIYGKSGCRQKKPALKHYSKELSDYQLLSRHQLAD